MNAEAVESQQAAGAGTGRYPGAVPSRAEANPPTDPRTKTEPMALMEAVLESSNLKRAYQRVVGNKGAAGVDVMPTSDLKDHLIQHWLTLKERLLAGDYQPHPVRRVTIPKPQGGTRQLGIPTVQDRLIQQALHQVLSPMLEPHFSDSSYGFRPGRSAHDAVIAMQRHAEAGHRWVVDIDLAQFFDRVNHDVLMSLLARRIDDPRILKLIRSYLKAGVLEGGVTTARVEGTPQGGPLSPLLSNVLLTELDRELERRGHRFCRYADDCNIYVRSRQAGERVMHSVTRLLERHLKLKVNRDKSAVDRPWNRVFLGYSLTRHKRPRLMVPMANRRRFKGRLKAVFRQARGGSMVNTLKRLAPILRGWTQYYRLSGSLRVFEELDGWVRRRLRLILWRQWKRPFTRANRLMRLGLSEERAWKSATNGRGPWWNSGASHMNAALPKKLFDKLGLVSMLEVVKRFQC